MKWEDMMRQPARLVQAEMPVKRLIAVSDIHGNYKLFTALLEKLEYKPGEDGLVVVGDLVPKGPESIAAVQYAMELAKHPNTYFLHGNHELLQEQDADGLLGYINWWKEKSLLGEMLVALGEPWPQSPEDIPGMLGKLRAAYGAELAFLHGFPDILETKNLIFAHAGLTDEDTEHQLLGPVVESARFHETVEHTFKKLLVVGHYPTANFRTDELSNAPILNEKRNVLSIDGGNQIRFTGQLNAVIFDPSTGEWTWDYVDQFQKIQAPCTQAYAPGFAMMWPNTAVEILHRGEAFTHCRYLHNGAEVEVPNDMLYENEDGVSTKEITTERLAVEEGEPLSLIASYPHRLLVMKQGKIGWLVTK